MILWRDKCIFSRRRPLKQLIVFDFDGVIADSETLANAVLAEIMTELGAPMTPDASVIDLR